MAIIRNNRQYLVEHLQVKGLPDKLSSADSLTDLHRRLVNSRKSAFDKNMEFLEILKRKNTSEYLAFTDYLRKNNQRVPARILENGGVVETLKLKCYDSTNIKWKEHDIVQRLNDLQNKKIPWNREIQTQQIRLRALDLEILNSYNDNGVAICIHCKSQKALQLLTSPTPSSDDALDALTTLITSASGLKFHVSNHKLVSFEEYSSAKDMVVCSTAVQLFGTIDASGNFLKGIAKLHNKIYLVYNTPKSLRVYLNELPFTCEKEIKIDAIDKPEHAAACEISNCVYILDENKRCIWKLTGDVSLALWLTFTDSVDCFSVCADGRVVVLRTKKWNMPPDLDIYDSGAKLHHRIRLPDEIVLASEIIETSSGNFVVLHKRVMRNDVWAMSEITQDAVIVRHFETKHEPQFFPHQLCLDANDRIVVADFYNRIDLYDHDIIFAQTLIEITSEFYWFESKMYFDKQERKIILGHNEWEIKIYQLNYF